MKLLDNLQLVVLLRSLNRLVRSLDGRQAEQNRYLKRLADKFAPDLDSQPVDQHTRSVDYAEDREQGHILDTLERLQKTLGREPTEDEVINALDMPTVTR